MATSTASAGSPETDFDGCIANLYFESDREDRVLEIPICYGKEVRIGRDRICDYSILDDRVSKQHFRIYSIVFERPEQNGPSKYPAMVYCEDLESRNGTYVNDTLIGILGSEKVGHLLCSGDVVEIRPHWKFQFNQPRCLEISRDKDQQEDLEYFQSRFTVSDRILGTGLFGEVFLATENATDQQLACKIVNLKAAGASLSAERPSVPGILWQSGVQRGRQETNKALKEIEILSVLSHPNVIDLRKAFMSDNMLYIFTELATGGDLFSYVDSHGGRIDDLNARVVSRQVVLALQYLHSKSIAHRDIKPENILITRVEFGCRVVLTDFGLACDTTSRSRMLSKVGTEGYIAPEIDAVEKSDRGYTMTADMWSLGITTTFLLTGDTVIPRGEMSQLSQIQIAERFLHSDDSQVARHWTSVSSRAHNFLRRLLVVEPEQRMSATEAVNHPWYKEPSREAKEMERAYDRVNRFWRKRGKGAEVIENLPTRTQVTTDSAVQKCRRQKIPDASSSPYFSLDRRLNQKTLSKKRQMLAELNESGSHFVASEDTQDATVSRSRYTSKITDIEGIDLFGTSTKQPTMDSDQGDLDEMSLIESSAVIQPEESIDLDAAYVVESVKSKKPLTGKTPMAHRSSLGKRVRQETSPEDRTIFDLASREVPRYCSANVLKDTVTRLKQTMQTRKGA